MCNVVEWDQQVDFFVSVALNCIPRSTRSRAVISVGSSWVSVSDLQERAIKEYGQIDVVAANAGVAEIGVLLDDRRKEENGRPKVSIALCLVPDTFRVVLKLETGWRRNP